MEKTSSNTWSPSFSLASFVEFLFLHEILKWAIIFKMFYSSLQSFLQSQFDLIFCKSKACADKKNLSSELLSGQFCFHERGDDGKLFRGDVVMLMENLGIFCNPDGDKLQERLGVNEFSILFKEEEPSLEEVKEAFDVFDENKDGFIDARELQSILFCLGFKVGSELKECESMIRVFDENGDGLIDFNEFVKFMEKSFC